MIEDRVRLSDRFDLGCSPVVLNGTQALVRLMLMQSHRDRQQGLDTAGFVTGYRGSPLGAVDFQMDRAKEELTSASIVFQAGLNEDLAATALWGTQQAELRGEGLHDGVFGLWYGKGPGVDRSGDVFKHANLAGASRFGGVLAAFGDDHTCESSTTAHQSDLALMNAHMPVLSPAGVQEILDFGIFGFALSRFSGNWVGLKCVKETIESTAVVDGQAGRMQLIAPEFEMPPHGLNIRLIDTPVAQEERLIRFRLDAAVEFSRVNGIDQRVFGKPGATIGFVAAGKNWLDLRHAFDLLGIDDAEAARLGLTAYKVGMTWPLDQRSFADWADGLKLIIVVEEKRKLIESLIREVLIRDLRGRRLYGQQKAKGEQLFQTHYALEPMAIAEEIGQILIEEERGTERIEASLNTLKRNASNSNFESIAKRRPYFCSGCPHNLSTKVPTGSRAYAGIGCHFMAQWMDRETVGFTHMGGEGANWIGESLFSKRSHVFQNLGDGTYNHSGIMAVRAAVASNTNITFKLLFNDAVAMTGGQKNDGGLDAAKITRELEAIGVNRIAVVYDKKENVDFSEFPASAEYHERAQLDSVQRRFREIEGVTAIVYVQTCAAEKRRRRKRGRFPDPDKRIFINSEVCEGCGDCGIQSNCVSIIPIDTPFGRKRAIDQSSCNKDFSCIEGFCPSFVTLNGAMVRKKTVDDLAIPSLPDPVMPSIDKTFNIVISGVGGTGLVTIGAVLSMAGFLDGKGVGMIEMAGLAQKGGAVHIHCRIAASPEDISAIRIADAEADCVIGGDLVVAAGSDSLALLKTGRTRAVVNSQEIMTGDFTRSAEFELPFERLKQRIEAELGAEGVAIFNASSLAKRLLGDSIYSNMLLLGAAWQRGSIPISAASIREAIKLNGASPDSNLKAFEFGRWAAVAEPAEIDPANEPNAQDCEQSPFEVRKEHLAQHSNRKLAERYEEFVRSFPSDALREAVALGYHKVLAVKDEYEVARLHLKTAEFANREFEDGFSMTYHLAPPIFSGIGSNGRPRKREFGSWMRHAFKILAKLKSLRGTPLDVFGYSAERKQQRQWIRMYEADMKMLRDDPSIWNADAALELARLPLVIRGFGPVWEENYRAAMLRREELRKSIAVKSIRTPVPAN